jgi:hypothetical protein
VDIKQAELADRIQYQNEANQQIILREFLQQSLSELDKLVDACFKDHRYNLRYASLSTYKKAFEQLEKLRSRLSRLLYEAAPLFEPGSILNKTCSKTYVGILAEYWQIYNKKIPFYLKRLLHCEDELQAGYLQCTKKEKSFKVPEGFDKIHQSLIKLGESLQDTKQQITIIKSRLLNRRPELQSHLRELKGYLDSYKSRLIPKVRKLPRWLQRFIDFFRSENQKRAIVREGENIQEILHKINQINEAIETAIKLLENNASFDFMDPFVARVDLVELECLMSEYKSCLNHKNRWKFVGNKNNSYFGKSDWKLLQLMRNIDERRDNYRDEEYKYIYLCISLSGLEKKQEKEKEFETLLMKKHRELELVQGPNKADIPSKFFKELPQNETQQALVFSQMPQANR